MAEFLDLTLGLLGLATSVVFGVGALYLAYLFFFRRQQLQASRGYAWLCRLARWLELPGVALVVCLCIAVSVVIMGSLSVSNNEPVFIQLHRWASNPLQFLAAFAMIEFALPLLAAFLALRWISMRPAAIWMALALLVGGVAVIFFRHQQMFVADVLRNDPNRMFDLPIFFIPMRSWWVLRTLDFVPPIVAAVVAYSMVPRWWAFFVGGGAAALGVQWLANPEIRLAEPVGIETRDWKSLAIGTCVSLVVLALLWCLPRQRAGLLRAAGLDGESAADDGPIASTVAKLGRGTAFALALAVPVFLFAMARFQSDFVEQLVRGPRPLVHSPALQNAWEPMREHFVKESATEKSLRKLTTLRAVRDINHFCFDSDEPERIETFRALVTAEVRAKLAADEDALADVIAAFEAAGRSDYLAPYDDDGRQQVSYLVVRELSRWLALRSRIRASDGDWRGALDDINMIHRYTALDVDHILVTHMIHAAMRGIACDASTFYWQAFRDNRDAMQALADALEHTAVGNRRSYPIESIRRHEPGLRSVVPMAEIAFPGMSRAYAVYSRAAGYFDALRMVAALELYRLDNGAYPGSLDALVPQYMSRIPPDPFDGKPWLYAVDSDHLVLETERYRSEYAKNPKQATLYKPPTFPLPAKASAATAGAAAP